MRKSIRNRFNRIVCVLVCLICSTCLAVQPSHAEIIAETDNNTGAATVLGVSGFLDIVYYANGGDGAPESQRVALPLRIIDIQDDITLSSTIPNREGYNFLGWATSQNSSSPLYSSGQVCTSSSLPKVKTGETSNVPVYQLTLYAVWTPKTYTVSYSVGAGTGMPASQIKVHGQDLTLSTQKPTRIGYRFVRWKSLSTGESYSPGSIYTNNSDLSLSAVWEPSIISISFNANSGTGAPASIVGTYGKRVQLRGSVPTWEGHTFLGWSNEKTATTATYGRTSSIVLNRNITLYAVWKVDSIPTITPTFTPTPVVTITATPTPRPTATARPTATPTPRPTATARPTVTPTPRPTATARPTVTPTPRPIATIRPTATPTAIPTQKVLVSAVYNSVQGADIRWKKLSGASGYVVYRFRSGEGMKKVATINNANTVQCYDRAVRTNCWGRVYTYYIFPLYGNARGVKSDPMILQRLAPMRLTNYYSPSAGTVALSWTCTVNDNKAVGYEIQYARSKSDLSNKTGTFNSVSISGRYNTSGTLRGLQSGAIYYFRVRGYVNYINSVTKKVIKTWSQYSDVVSVRTGSSATPTPTPRPIATPTPTISSTTKDISKAFNMDALNAAVYLGLKRVYNYGNTVHRYDFMGNVVDTAQQVYFTKDGGYSSKKSCIICNTKTLSNARMWCANIKDISMNIYGVTVGTSVSSANSKIISKGWTLLGSSSSYNWYRYSNGPDLTVYYSNGKVTRINYDYDGVSMGQWDR